MGIKAALNVPRKSELVNEQIRGSMGKPALDAEALLLRHPLSHPMGGYPIMGRANSPQYPEGVHKPDPGHGVGHFDASALHIQHAVNQTKLNHTTSPSVPNGKHSSNSNNGDLPPNASNSSSSHGGGGGNTNGNALLRHSVRPGIEGRINDFLVSVVGVVVVTQFASFFHFLFSIFSFVILNTHTFTFSFLYHEKIHFDFHCHEKISRFFSAL